MRVISIIVAIVVAFSLYFLIVDRNSLINFISKFQNEEKIETNLETKDNKLSQVFSFRKKNENMGPYVVQIGAFSSKENAKRLKLQVSQLGHDVTINKVDSNGKTFFAVRVNRYKSKRKAEEIGKDIKSKLGVNFRVLYRPS